MPRSDRELLRVIHPARTSVPGGVPTPLRAPVAIGEAIRPGKLDDLGKLDDELHVQEAALDATMCRALERAALSKGAAMRDLRHADDAERAHVCHTSARAMCDVAAMVERVADSDVSVFLTGESGVGKEVVAQELHRRSARRGKPFVKVNCAALPADLLESELFGHERGAFTGAQASRIGKFEYASGGTILLDEIAEMPVALQAKLLHVLEDGEVTRLGSNRQVAIDVRVLAATNRDVDAMMRAGQFRTDLYYRLQVIEIRIPPLRERREEIVPLAECFLRQYAELYNRPSITPSKTLLDALVAHDWPGNIRELENTIKRLVILRDEALLLAALRRDRAPVAAMAASQAVVDAPVRSAVADAEPIGKLCLVSHAAAVVAEREAICRALDHLRWNRRKTAALLGVSYRTLLNKMKECGISGPTSCDSDAT